MRYIVTITRTVTALAHIPVEAKNEDEAAEKALAAAEKLDSGSEYDWEPDDETYDWYDTEEAE